MMMMNNTDDSSYNIPNYMLPFIGIETNNNNNNHNNTIIINNHHKQQNLSWDFDTTASNNTASLFEYQQQQQSQSLLPMNNSLYPFYSPSLPLVPAAEHHYSLGLIKKELDGFGGGNSFGGRLGLNLGHRTYFSSSDVLAIDRIFGRSRGLYSLGHQPPRCQAEGCKADLSGAKHYHRRHKVCEYHSKAAIVVIAGGLHQRFCQQCSRFHALSEFDESKRSCRKRLADHNRRRRKPTTPSNSKITNKPNSANHNTNKPAISSKDITTKKVPTTSCTSNASANVNITNCVKSQLEGSYHNKENLFMSINNGPALSLGAGLSTTLAAKSYQISYNDGPNHDHEFMLNTHEENKVYTQQRHQNNFSSNSNSNTTNFQHNNTTSLFMSASPYEASQSIEESNHDQHSNLLHLGQAMYEVDFL